MFPVVDGRLHAADPALGCGPDARRTFRYCAQPGRHRAGLGFWSSLDVRSLTSLPWAATSASRSCNRPGVPRRASASARRRRWSSLSTARSGRERRPGAASITRICTSCRWASTCSMCCRRVWGGRQSRALIPGRPWGAGTTCSPGTGERWLACEPATPRSQFFRRLIAEHAGHGASWDHNLHPWEDNVRRTLERFH